MTKQKINPEKYGRPRTRTLKCEGCCLADITALAVRLSDAGVGDYWEDVDQYVRNQLVEQQFVNADLMRKMSEAGPEHEAKPPMESAEEQEEGMRP